MFIARNKKSPIKGPRRLLLLAEYFFNFLNNSFDEFHFLTSFKEATAYSISFMLSIISCSVLLVSIIDSSMLIRFKLSTSVFSMSTSSFNILSKPLVNLALALISFRMNMYIANTPILLIHPVAKRIYDSDHNTYLDHMVFPFGFSNMGTIILRSLLSKDMDTKIHPLL